MKLVAPETWYRLYWLVWAIAVLVVARLWLVNPLIRAITESKK